MKLAGVLQENDPAAFEAMLNGDKDAVKYIEEYIDNLNSLDPETYAEMEQAREQGDWNAYETRYAQCIKDARLYENLNKLYGINPEVYNDMAYVGEEFENNKTVDMPEISQNSDLEARLTRLENTLSEYIQMQQGINPQTQARAGEEKDDKARAIYEKDGVRIEVAEGLEQDQEQELQHGQEFNQAAEEVTAEDLEQADREVKERDAITEDGTTQIILANSKKITITVEPYVAGDKDTQMAQEANEQEQIATKDTNTEIANDTARG